MRGIRLNEPIPITEVARVEAGDLLSINGYHGAWYPWDRLHAVISDVLGLSGLPLEPTRYLAEEIPNEHTHVWHTDSGEQFFNTPDICLYANRRPAQVVRGEVPILTNADWKNFSQPNLVVEKALETGTAEIFTLTPNVYYLLRSPAIHRGPGPTDDDNGGLRLSARWMQ